MERSAFIYPGSPREPFLHSSLSQIADRIKKAKERGGAIVIACGGHVVKQGLNPLLISLMEKGFISHLAVNGSVAIHDFELALIGASTESVARYVRTGEFGLWQETGRINDAVSQGYREGLGFGESVGNMIDRERFPFRETSLLAAGVRLQLPVTVHIGIGYDIVHEHPNFDGAAAGGASHRDFLILAETLARLQGGVFLNIGTSVMGPEVFLKALTMARNAAHQSGRKINEFTTAVFDLVAIGEDLHAEAPKTDPRYYFRPYKTILVRTVADGGESFYIQGEHRRTIPALYDLLTGEEK
jgi:hypothetical protein